MQSHIRKVNACLAVTCRLHFWQNDRDLLHATAVTRGWNGYRNKSQHRKLTLENKILPPLLQGFVPATFQSRVRRSNHWAIPAPKKDTLENTCFVQLCYRNNEAVFDDVGVDIYVCISLCYIQIHTQRKMLHITDDAGGGARWRSGG